MFNHYLKIALRSIQKQKIYSFIQIIGLGIGFAVTILMLLYVQFELSFDQYHENANQIYRVTTETTFNAETSWHRPETPHPLGPALKEDFPEVLNFTRIIPDLLDVLNKDQVFNENEAVYSDPAIFQIFSIKLLKGDPETALLKPFSIVIAEEIARKYFSTENPINKILHINENDYRVTGLMEKIPANSHLSFSIILSLSSLEKIGADKFNDWTNTNIYTYIQLPIGYPKEQLEAKFHRLIEKHKGERSKASWKFYLQPLTRIHLYSKFEHDIAITNNYRTILIYLGLAIFILLIACINFVNLSIGLFAYRFREIGVRKIMGANRIEIMKQFGGEILIITLIAIFFGLVLAELFLPTLNRLVSRDISLNFNLSNTAALMGLMIFTVLVAGTFPAVVLSAFNPVGILRDKLKIGSPNKFTRGLLIIQYVLSIFFMITAALTWNQLHFIKKSHNRIENVRVIGIPLYSLFRIYPNESERAQKVAVFKEEITKHRRILSATQSNYHFGYEGGYYGDQLEVEDRKISADAYWIDYDYPETFGLKIVDGRDFSESYVSDKNESILINETLAKELFRESPVGKKILFRGYGIKNPEIIGVVNDFHLTSLHEKIRPLILQLGLSFYYCHIKMDSEDISETLAFINNKWNEIFPTIPFSCSFHEDELKHRYSSEQQLHDILSYSFIFAILLCNFGIFGLVSLLIKRRTKEISIRKVLGASVYGLMGLINKELLVLVAVANILAWPIAYFSMNKWLQNFAYRIHISIWPFLLAGLLALLIAGLTVGWQTIRAALANPVESLRYE